MNLLKDFETNEFPAEFCTVQNARESDVRDSNTPYLCVLSSVNNPNECRIMTLFPYTANEIEGQMREAYLYGWVDQYGNSYDHKERAIHLDDERVIAWRRIDETTVTTFAPTSWNDPIETDN